MNAFALTHWAWKVSSTFVNYVLGNDLLPVRLQAITRNDTDLISIVP